MFAKMPDRVRQESSNVGLAAMACFVMAESDEEHLRVQIHLETIVGCYEDAAKKTKDFLEWTRKKRAEKTKEKTDGQGTP